MKMWMFVALVEKGDGNEGQDVFFGPVKAASYAEAMAFGVNETLTNERFIGRSLNTVTAVDVSEAAWSFCAEPRESE